MSEAGRLQEIEALLEELRAGRLTRFLFERPWPRVLPSLK